MLLLILLISLSFAYTNDRCSNAKVINLLEKSDFEVTEDTSVVQPSSYKIGGEITTQKGRWYLIKTGGTGMNIEIDTCFSGTTNFDTVIYVFAACEDGVGKGIVALNDDSYQGCGSAARLLMNDIKREEFYVFISGSDSEEVGVFGLIVNKHLPNANLECKDAFELTIPTFREGTTTGVAPNFHDLSGLYYYVVGTGKDITISTCHRSTNVDTIISVFESCDNPQVVSANHDCDNGYMGSYTKFFAKQGQRYTIHISSSPKKRGMFVAEFKYTEDSLPDLCNKAFAITTIPYASSHIIETNKLSQSCGSSQHTGLWYTIIGDENDYVFYTCNSENENGVSTSIEIFESCESTKGCERNSNGCGNHGKIIKHLEYRKMYFIKVSCLSGNGQCRVTLNVEKLGKNGGINSCILGKAFEFKTESDLYSDTFDASGLKPVQIQCGGFNRIKGKWYRITNTLRKPFPLFIQAHLMLPTSIKHTAEIQMFRKCNDQCEEHQQSIIHVSMKPKETISFFVFSADDGLISVYAKKDNRTIHDTCMNAIEINAPFSLVEYKSNMGKKTKPVCGSTLMTTHTGLYYYFQSPVTDTFIVETCAIETQFDTYVEVFEGCGKTQRCIQANDDSPECGSTASYVRFEAQQGAEYYIYVAESSKTKDTEGTFRLNVYTLNPPINSKCSKAEPLTPGLRQHELTKYSYESTSNCKDFYSLNKYSEIKKLPTSHLLGLWYYYKAEVKGTLTISTCDAGTSVRSRIGIYKSCYMTYDVSHPTGCIAENAVSQESCSIRGTSLSVDMEKGDNYYIFVGGETSLDVGFVSIDSSFKPAPTVRRIALPKYKVRVGPKRLKERKAGLIFWGTIVLIYAGICVVGFIGYKAFRSNNEESYLSAYHEL